MENSARSLRVASEAFAELLVQFLRCATSTVLTADAKFLRQIYCVVQPLVFQWLLSKLRRGIEGDGVVTS